MRAGECDSPLCLSVSLSLPSVSPSLFVCTSRALSARETTALAERKA